MWAIFSSVLNSAEATPINSLFISLCPCLSFIWAATLGTNQKFRKSIFAAVLSKRSKRFIGGAPFAASPCKLCLHCIEQISVHNSRMIIADKVFGSFASINFRMLTDAVCSESFLINHISDILFIGEYSFYIFFAPNRFAGCGFYSVIFKVTFSFVPSYISNT